MKKVWEYVLSILGISHDSKYVRNYLNDANMRSGIYMGAVIVVLEIWLVIRQTIKYVFPKVFNEGKEFFITFYKYTGSYWLLMSLGMVMLWYCLLFVCKKHHISKMALGTLIACSVSITVVALVPIDAAVLKSFSFASFPFGVVSTTKIILYFLILLFNIAAILDSLYIYKYKKSNRRFNFGVIALFAAACLMFGVMVSYSDFAGLSSSKEQKMVTCFLMFAIYVGCLLVWRPLLSFGFLGAMFLGFYLLINNVQKQIVWENPGRVLFEGDTINYITFFVALIMVCVSIYNQRHKEALKDEELELLATKDRLTGLYSFDYFTTLVTRKIDSENIKEESWVFLFLDITSFKIFNDQRGFEEGNHFLKEVGVILTNHFYDGLVSRQSDDHFVAFIPKKNIEERLISVNKEVEKLDLDIRPGVKAGVYTLRDKKEDPHAAIEKARYACAAIKHIPGHKSIFYDAQMHDAYRQVQYIVRHIDEAIEKGYLHIAYQPIISATDDALSGAEALARWSDPKYGEISPAIFIPALESAQLIHKLDEAVLRMVCSDLCRNLDTKLPVVPISVNFSRLDFTLLNVAEIVERVIREYNIPRHLINVEITESALQDDAEALKKSMANLHEKGFKIWLDDFGSGYSSFNVLKDFDFDGLKLDMKFLSDFSKNDKAKVVIKSVISMAKEMGIHTLCEGVETMEQLEFLKISECEKFQGYLFGRPQTFEQIKGYTISKDLLLPKN